MPPTKADYAKINIACKQLGLDKYQLIGDRYGIKSTKNLTAKNLEDLYAHFRSLGWQPKKPNKATKTGKTSDNYIKIKPGPAAAQQRKVLAMWNALGYPMDKLHTRCKKQFKVERFEWLTSHADLHILITDLQQRLNRSSK